MSFLLASLLRGAAISGIGLLAVALLHRASAATRGAVGAVVLGAMLALPLGLRVAPKRAVPAERIPLARFVVAPPRAESPPPTPNRSTPILPSSPSVRRVSWGVGAAGVWTLGAIGLVSRVLVGWFVAIGWARRAERLSTEGSASAGTRASRDDGNDLSVRVSSEVEVPCAFWAGRSIVLLPASQAGWSEARRRAVILHETAHVSRGDWAVLVLSRLTVALHWPNPLVWALARTVRRAAEDAADDAVLRTGLAPADYADHLLALSPRRPSSGLTLPMATRPDVFRRIKHVLNPNRTRGSVGIATLTVASLLVGGVFVPSVCLVLPRQAVLKPVFQANPSSYAADVRDGKTSPGTPQNGFVGHLADGRPARIVQISMRTPQGIKAWGPDGMLLAGSGKPGVPTLAERHLRTILIRYEKRTAHPEGGLGSGPTSLGEPSTMVFAGGGDQPGPTASEEDSFSYIGVPKEDGDHASFTFSLNDSPWTTDATVPATVGAFGDHGRVHGLGVAYPEMATPFHRDAKGTPVKDGKGGWRHDRVPSTGVAFRMDPDDAQRGIRLVATLKGGKRVEPLWNDGKYVGREFHHHWYFNYAPQDILRIDVETRPTLNVEFLEVRLKPNGR